MTATWPNMPLGDACRINPKFDRDGSVPPDSLVSFVPMAAVDETAGRIASAELRTFAEVARGYTPFQDGDVLFAKITPCMQNGKAAIAQDLHNGVGFGSTEFHVLRPHRFVLPEWVFAFIRQPAFRAEAEANFTGTAGQQRVPVEFLRRVTIPIPPVEEQRRIVRLLDAAEALRRLRQQADRRTAELVPAIFHEMFGDPATNPKGWPVVPVGDLMLSCEYGSSEKANEEGQGIVILRMNNVAYDGLLDLTDLKNVELSESERIKQELASGDVLFNRTNSRVLVGKTGMWDGRFPAVAASYFIRIRFDQDKEHPQHFTTFMNMAPIKRKLMAIARGAIGQANINGTELRSIRMPLPPIHLQRQFAARVAEARALETRQAESRRRLDALYQSMLHRAFRGEL